MNNKEEYVVVCWPESQEIAEQKGFRENCRLINGERGLKEYGSCAYLAPISWLSEEHEKSDEDYTEELEVVGDEELEELYLL